MQSKISSFFKPTTPTVGSCPPPPSDELDSDGEQVPSFRDLDVLVTYSRRTPKPPSENSQNNAMKGIDDLETGVSNSISACSSAGTSRSGRCLNKKRSYAQYHLELGQSDFLLHTCSGCGMVYTCGDELEEKAHKVHHKNYHEGIQFKGWNNERQIPMPWPDGERVILVLDGDPPFQKRKVQEVLKLMERDLSLSKEWLFHKLCKVFLFISRSRIVACLIAESIKTAHRVMSRVGSFKSFDDKGGEAAKSTLLTTEVTASKSTKPRSSILHFGNATLYREVNKRYSSKVDESLWEDGALLCSEESVDAVCGIRALWVVPSLRRHGIATRLLDAARRNFVTNIVLETSQCAFSQPTSAGQKFASSYSGTPSFLIYKPY